MGQNQKKPHEKQKQQKYAGKIICFWQWWICADRLSAGKSEKGTMQSGHCCGGGGAGVDVECQISLFCLHFLIRDVTFSLTN